MSPATMLILLIILWVAVVTAISIAPIISDHLRANRDYDRLINTLIDGDMFDLKSDYAIKSGGLVVWISNYPSSFGYPYDCGLSSSLTITRPTKWKLKRYIERKSVLAALQMVKRGEA